MGAGNPQAAQFSNTMAQDADPKMAQAWGLGQGIMSRMAGMTPGAQGNQQAQQQIQSALSRMNPFMNKPKPRGQFSQRTPGVRY